MPALFFLEKTSRATAFMLTSFEIDDPESPFLVAKHTIDRSADQRVPDAATNRPLGSRFLMAMQNPAARARSPSVLASARVTCSDAFASSALERPAGAIRT